MRPADSAAVLRRMGRRIAELRVARGMTQEGFAEHAKVSARWVQVLESGRQNLSVKVLVRLANLLRVDPAELLARPSEQPARVRRRRDRK